MLILTLSALVLTFITLSGTLELQIFSSPMEVSVNEDILLKCTYNQLESNLSHVAVQWLLDLPTSQREVFRFNGGSHVPRRRGARISEEALRKGNASLYLPNVQRDEEGKYTCVIFVTPHKAEKSSVLLVSVKPKVNIFKENVLTENGTENFVTCHAMDFYPKEIAISWFTLSEDKLEVISKSRYIEDMAMNRDGTFNLSSKIRIGPPVESHIVYTCEVKHKKFHTNVTSELPEDHGQTGLIIGAICGSGIFLCVVCVAFYTWKEKCKGQINTMEDGHPNRTPLIATTGSQTAPDDAAEITIEHKPNTPDGTWSEERTTVLKVTSVPKSDGATGSCDVAEWEIERQDTQNAVASEAPTIIDIKNQYEVVHGEAADVSWNVIMNSLVPMDIVISLKRKGEQEAKTLFHWQLSAEQLQGPKRVTQPLKTISHLCNQDKSFSADQPELQHTHTGLSQIHCCIKVQPDLSTDDAAEITIEHKPNTPDDTWSEERTTVLKVTSVPKSDGATGSCDVAEWEIERQDTQNAGASEALDSDITTGCPVEGEREKENLENQSAGKWEVPDSDVTTGSPDEGERQARNLENQNARKREVMDSDVTTGSLDEGERQARNLENQNAGKRAAPDSDVTTGSPDEGEKQAGNLENRNEGKREAPDSDVTTGSPDEGEKQAGNLENRNEGKRAVGQKVLGGKRGDHG
ncbi:uncharacterized protein LOC144602449 [Rhinoraja longicauda]